jgi:flagellar biosynthesis/type III secretory pathway M-ring protein FliF/YscJ
VYSGSEQRIDVERWVGSKFVSKVDELIEPAASAGKMRANVVFEVASAEKGGGKVVKNDRGAVSVAFRA